MSFNRILLTVATLITLISTLLIGLSTSRLSQTHDEPTHIASGIEFLQGEYVLNPQNPPISRLGLALFPYLTGVRVVKPDDFYEKYWGYGGGAGLVQKSMEEVGDYQEILVLARLGVMIYFLVALVLVFWIGKILSNSSGGAICVILFATTPVVMAHSGLATTDVPSMTTYLLAFLILIWWFQKPTWIRSIWLGLALSLAVTTKFTAIVFITPLILILYLLKKYLDKKTDLSFFNHLKFFSVAILSSLIITWAIYGFSWGEVGAIPIDPLATFNGSENCYTEDAVAATINSWNAPAPEFLRGNVDNWCMNQKPWPGYLMGEYKPLGSWKFYPIAFFLKSTISMQLLLLFSIVIIIKYRFTEWRLIGVLSVIVMIFSISLVSNLNIGIRHIIHVFPFICLLIGIVFIKFQEELKGRRKLLVLFFYAAVIGHQIAVAYSSWPHMLSYFNSFAGDEPGEYIVDSDLYWGQSMYGLESYCKENNVDSLNMAVFHTNKFCAYDLPKLNFIYPYDSVKGWVAIDEYTYRQLAFWLGNEECTMNFDMFPEIPFEERYSWLRSYEPVAKVGGEGIRIYYID